MTHITSTLDFALCRILVVGDVMLDSYWHGQTSRISPEAPVPIVKVDQEEARLGGAANVALNAAVLGARTSLLGLAGNDATADQIDVLLKNSEVSSYLQRVPGSKTITKLRVLSRHQQLIRLDFEDHFPNWNPETLLHDFTALLDEIDVVILSDYAKGVLCQCGDLVRAARSAGKPVLVDPKGQDFERYRGATLITPNLSEFEAVVGRCENDSEIERKGIELRDALDLEAILVTRSEKGMTLLARGHAPIHLPARAQEVFDVTGAGDTVVATLGVALAAGMSMAEAMHLSNMAAGVVVSKLGTATVTSEELGRASRQDQESFRRGIFDEESLYERVSEARKRGESIVMVTGCFDVLHPGYLDQLEKARALGDRLIVAVNDDSSVQRLKRGNKPINPLASRMRMLAALACVDWVMPFSEDTSERLYARFLPDILVEDGNNTEEQMMKMEILKFTGNEAWRIDVLDEHSIQQ